MIDANAAQSAGPLWVPEGLLPKDHILGPRELHGVASPELYEKRQKLSYVLGAARAPFLNWRPPWVYTGQPLPMIVSGSQWQLVCPCGNYPSFEPEWALACCFECMAVIRQQPREFWWFAQQVLVRRPKLENRHWLIGESVRTLVRENVEHGDPIPEGADRWLM